MLGFHGKERSVTRLPHPFLPKDSYISKSDLQRDGKKDVIASPVPGCLQSTKWVLLCWTKEARSVSGGRLSQGVMATLRCWNYCHWFSGLPCLPCAWSQHGSCSKKLLVFGGSGLLLNAGHMVWQDRSQKPGPSAAPEFSWQTTLHSCDHNFLDTSQMTLLGEGLAASAGTHLENFLKNDSALFSLSEKVSVMCVMCVMCDSSKPSWQAIFPPRPQIQDHKPCTLSAPGFQEWPGVVLPFPAALPLDDSQGSAETHSGVMKI